MFRNITTTELSALMKEIKIQVIDIRSLADYNAGHLREAIHIPLDQLMKNPDQYLSFDKSYYLICQTGSRGIKLGHYLSKLGYNMINIVGGYNNWQGRLIK